MREKKKKIDLTEFDAENFTIGLALGAETKEQEADLSESQTAQKSDITKSTLRLKLETKGRAGKNVTVLEGLDPAQSIVSELIKSLKLELGCGASVQSETILFQGDQRQRLFTLLQKKNFIKVKMI